ncbi:MAG: hypothetical protein IPL65_15575 [Lewinellaceae bacterium]|nr:hypothetical protein [Lewinellaceae bacterium]
MITFGPNFARLTSFSNKHNTMSFCKNISVATTAFPLLFSIFLLSWSPQQIDASILHSALITQDTTPPAPTAIVIKAEPNPAMPDAKPGTLFAGIDNIISLDIPKGVNPDNIQVQLDGGNVHKLAAGRYVITLEKPGAVAINTFLVEGNNRKFMGGAFLKSKMHQRTKHGICQKQTKPPCKPKKALKLVVFRMLCSKAERKYPLKATITTSFISAWRRLSRSMFMVMTSKNAPRG